MPSFVLSYFSTGVFRLLFLPSFCYAEGTTIGVVDSSFPIVFLMVPLIIFKGLTASLIAQPGSFALPALMGGTGIALLFRRLLYLSSFTREL